MFNLGKLQSEHKAFLRAHDAMVHQELEAAGRLGAEHPGKHATFHHRTHALEKATGFKVVRTRGGHLVRIFNPKKYAPYLEFGTRPHTITAKHAKALRFVAGGQVLFRKSVHHPGTKPYRFLYRATSAAFRVAGANLEAGMERLAKRF